MGQYLACDTQEKVLLLHRKKNRSCYQGTCDPILFNIWVKKFLLSELQPYQVVIMDNATFHKSAETKKLIEGAGCRVLFLPPDLNPVEQVWANLKRKMRE